MIYVLRITTFMTGDDGVEMRSRWWVVTVGVTKWVARWCDTLVHGRMGRRGVLDVSG
jgi:hypothetical protein